VVSIEGGQKWTRQSGQCLLIPDKTGQNGIQNRLLAVHIAVFALDLDQHGYKIFLFAFQLEYMAGDYEVQVDKSLNYALKQRFAKQS
jgi:hypothetical protein